MFATSKLKYVHLHLMSISYIRLLYSFFTCSRFLGDVWKCVPEYERNLDIDTLVFYCAMFALKYDIGTAGTRNKPKVVNENMTGMI